MLLLYYIREKRIFRKLKKILVIGNIKEYEIFKIYLLGLIYLIEIRYLEILDEVEGRQCFVKKGVDCSGGYGVCDGVEGGDVDDEKLRVFVGGMRREIISRLLLDFQRGERKEGVDIGDGGFGGGGVGGISGQGKGLGRLIRLVISKKLLLMDFKIRFYYFFFIFI